MKDQMYRDALSGRNIPIAEAHAAFDTVCAQNGRSTRTDVDDIHDLIEDALTLSVRAQAVVEAIIGGRGISADGCSKQPLPSGILNRIGEQSRHARMQIVTASEELERLARSFGV